jgi:DNA-binding MurR/RpiR family transcriptional regulator
MPPEDPLISRLREGATALSPNQRALARFVGENYQAAAFATVSELAGQSKVSEATIVRFAKRMGFKGWPELQKELRRLVRLDLRGAERLRLALDRKPSAPATLDLVIGKERENIDALYRTHDASSFRRAVQLLRRAPETLVVGTRSTAPLAYHLAFALNKLALPARRLTAITSETYDELSRLPLRTLVVVIGFPRYLRELVRLLAFVRERGLQTLAITDSAFSPLTADVNLYVPAESASFIAFHCAPLVLVNALVHELSAADKGRTLEALNAFEAVAEAQAYFHKA